MLIFFTKNFMVATRTENYNLEQAICIPPRASSPLASMGEQSKHFTVPTTTGVAPAAAPRPMAKSVTKAPTRAAAGGTRRVPMLEPYFFDRRYLRKRRGCDEFGWIAIAWVHAHI